MATIYTLHPFQTPDSYLYVTDLTPLPTVLRDGVGAEFGTALNPIVVSGAPAGAATIVDGGDVTLGAIADAAIAVGAVGTVSAKLRLMTTELDGIGLRAEAADLAAAADSSLISLLKGLITIYADVYDSVNHAIKVKVIP